MSYFLGTFNKDDIINKWTKKGIQHFTLILNPSCENVLHDEKFLKFYSTCIDDDKITIMAKTNKNKLPLIIDNCRPLFSLPKQGCMMAKIKNFTYVIYPALSDYDNIKKIKIEGPLINKIRKTFVFRYIWECKNTKELNILYKGDKIFSLHEGESFICEPEKQEILSSALIIKWFDDVSTSYTYRHYMTNNYSDINQLSDKIEEIILLYNKDLIWIKNSLLSNIETLTYS